MALMWKLTKGQGASDIKEGVTDNFDDNMRANES